MENRKLLEAVADIAYIAGYNRHYSGNSRMDIADYISWAIEFEEINKNTDWDLEDYMLLIEEFANKKVNQINM